jgi:hypothetical protein
MPVYDFECKQGHRFEHTCRISELDEPVKCTTDGCSEIATNVCTFGGLDHGIGLFRDQAREGRFDESNLSTRYMSSGRGSWRRR